MPSAHDIVILSQSSDGNTVENIGSKAYSRSILLSLKVPAPPAFVITSKVFEEFLNQEGLSKWNQVILNTRIHDINSQIDAAKLLNKIVLNHPFENSLADRIGKAYREVLGSHWAHLTISPTASTKAPVNFPLPVIKGETVLLDFLRQLWSAQITPQALALHLLDARRPFSPAPVMISQFEPAISSGTVYTVDPVTQDKNLIRIEAILGTNPGYELKPIPADNYLFTKDTNQIISRIISHQDFKIETDRFGSYRQQKVPERLETAPKLSSNDLLNLVRLSQKIHNFILKPAHINWLITKQGLLLTRFSETDPVKKSQKVRPSIQLPKNTKLVAEGLSASPGIATAPIQKIKANTRSIHGSIVVLPEAKPLYLSKIKSAAGIIIEAGGLTSELAHAARENGIPTVVGTGPIKLPEETVITLDAIHGQVLIDTTPPKPLDLPNQRITVAEENISENLIATKTYFNISQLDDTQASVYVSGNGVGVCRGTDIIMRLKTHPEALLLKEKNCINNALINELKPICQAFGDRIVWYHPYNPNTAVATELAEGKSYEPKEQNPIIGFYGACRLPISRVFKNELETINVLRHKHHCSNLSLVIPFVRSRDEFQKVKQMTAAAGLSRTNSFKIAAELATPASVTYFSDIIDNGVDAVFINLDILAALTMGYDPNSAEVDQFISYIHPMVLKTVNQIVSLADKSRTDVIVYGSRLDQQADIINALISNGVTSISINSHRFDTVKSWLQTAEKRLVLR